MESNFYASYAMYYEKYERNFTKPKEIYRLGILMTKNTPQAQEVIFQKFKDFGSRMVSRIERTSLRVSIQNRGNFQKLFRRGK